MSSITPAVVPSAAEQGYKPFRWFILVTLVVVTTSQFIALIAPAPLVPVIAQSGFALNNMGLITLMTMGIWNFVVAVAAIFGGGLIDKVGFIPLYIIGLALFMVAELLMPVMGTSVAGVMILRTIQALGGGPIMAAGAYVAANYFPQKERTIVTGMFSFSASAGISLGLLLIGMNVNSVGGTDWQKMWFWMWPVNLVGIVMTLVVLFGPKCRVVPPVAVIDGEKAKSNAALLGSALRQPVTWIIILCCVAASWFYQAFNDMTPGFLAANPPVGLGLGAAGTQAIQIAGFGGMAGALLVGFIVEYVFHRKVRLPLMIAFAVMALGSLSLLAQNVTDHAATMTIILTIVVFAFSFTNPSVFGYIANHYPGEITGKLGGFAQGIGVFGGLAGVAAGGTALAITGFYHVSTMIMAGVCVLGLIFALFIREKKNEQVIQTGVTIETGTV